MSFFTLYFIHKNTSEIKMQTYSNEKFANIALRYYSQAGMKGEFPKFVYKAQVLPSESPLTLDELNIKDQARIEVVYENNKKKSKIHY